MRSGQNSYIVASPGGGAGMGFPLLPTLMRVSIASAALLSGGAAPADEPPGPGAVLAGLESAWRARDAEAYLARWRFDAPDRRDAERRFLAGRWSADEALLELQPPVPDPRRSGRATAAAQVFTVSEPRGRVTQVLYTLERGADGWAIVGREEVGEIDGLVHLSLARDGFDAAGLAVRLPDFEITWRRGSVFTSPAAVGPTVLVFVGDGTVSFRPRPETEREQLRQYAGARQLVEKVRSAFVRIHPADFHRVLVPGRRAPDPGAAARCPAAERVYRAHVEEAFVLDTALPRSPWWLSPGLGDALVAFDSRRGTLTYALSRSEPEGISLFDRRRRRQIALYPVDGGDIAYDEDARRNVDVLHHDLAVRFDPDRAYLAGENRIRMRLLEASPTVRLRLDESLRVESIRSAEGGEHLFFRVRHQDSVMVSLGALAGRVGEVTLVVRFSGVHHPVAIEREVLQMADAPAAEEIPLEPVVVYSNRTAWYPQAGADDFATATLRFDVPATRFAVAGGTPGARHADAARASVEYRQDLPGKYITAAVGRLVEVAGDDLGRIRGFAVPRLRNHAPGVIADASAMVAFFETLFGPSPHPVLNLALIESRVPGGHAPPGMIVLSQRPPVMRGALRDDPASFWDVPGFFLAHEIAHQWWGHGVAARNYHDRWISEAMAHYAAALWVRQAHGEARFRDVMERMSRWALRHSAQGPLDLGHRLGHVKGDPQVYRAVVYDKGAWVLHMLREITGPEAFGRALAGLQREHRFRKAGTEHLRAALEAASGLDLAPYFRLWVHGTAVPELSFSRRTTAGPPFATAVTIRTRNVPGPLPVEIAVVHRRGRETSRVTLPPEGGTFTIETPSAPQRVEVNRDGGLLARMVRGRR